MPGLEFYVRDKKQHVFQQGTMLKQFGQSNNAGICLALSMTYMHFIRGGFYDPADIIAKLKDDAKLFASVVKLQDLYSSGKYSDEKMNYEQTLPTIVHMFRKTLDELVSSKLAMQKERIHLAPVGEYPAKERPKIAPDLFQVVYDCNPKMFLVTFNFGGGRLGLTGAHAIVVDRSRSEWGIFDPNFGFMELQKGFNSIELGVVLGEFADEYGIIDAYALQDISNL